MEELKLARIKSLISTCDKTFLLLISNLTNLGTQGQQYTIETSKFDIILNNLKLHCFFIFKKVTPFGIINSIMNHIIFLIKIKKSITGQSSKYLFILIYTRPQKEKFFFSIQIFKIFKFSPRLRRLQKTQASVLGLDLQQQVVEV